MTVVVIIIGQFICYNSYGLLSWNIVIFLMIKLNSVIVKQYFKDKIYLWTTQNWLLIQGTDAPVLLKQ